MKYVSAVLCMAVLFLLSCFGNTNVHYPFLPAAAPAFSTISVIGDEVTNGMYDISVEYGDDGIGWIAYSRIRLFANVETRIARSDDRGGSWKFVSLVNESDAGSLTMNGVSVTGTWRNETPSLMFDRHDSPQRRWKLFSQRYLVCPPYPGGESLFTNGWIEYRYAATPNGPWSERIRLFGGRENGCILDPRTLSPELAGYLFFNEIGTLCLSSMVFVSLDASPTASGLFDWEHRAIILLVSMDHCRTWSYLGKLTTYTDAAVFGYLAFTGSSLVIEDGKPHILLTPTGNFRSGATNTGHDGVFVVEFDDILRARLRRDGNGMLAVKKRIPLAPFAANGGLSDYHEQNMNGGLLFSQIVLGSDPEFFRVYSTGLRLSDK